MKTGFKSLQVKCLGLGFCAIIAAALAVSARTITLMDANSRASIDPNDQKGMFNWSVDGVNELYQQWFWYGIGTGTPQYSIDTIGGLSITQPNAASVYISYHNTQVSAQVDYVLTGGTAGSGLSQINESIHLVNTSASSLTLRFYQYSDFDLMGDPEGDTVQLYRNLGGKFYEAIQTKGNVMMSETDVVPGADHGEASLYPSLLNRLNGGSQIVLADNTGVAGPGDAAWALEWDVTLASGASLDISKNKQISPIPEPGTFALLGLGFVAFVWRKRQTA